MIVLQSAHFSLLRGDV